MKKRHIDEGRCGICYELESGEILKLFKKSKELDRLLDYEYFLKYLNDSIIFPQKFIIKRNQFKGYVTKKVNGEPFDKSLMIYNIDSLHNHTITLEKDIDFISKGNIKMRDVHSSNVFYDGNRICVIDPDMYQIVNLDSEDLFYINIKTIKELILDLLYLKIRETKAPFTDSIYNELRKYVMNDYEINCMILEYRRILENYYQRKITKFEDIGDTNGNMYSRTYGRR